MEREPLRICSRALLLLVLATARGVFACVEQPASSCMHVLPDAVLVKKLVMKLLGPNVWREEFLSGTKGRETTSCCTELDGYMGC